MFTRIVFLTLIVCADFGWTPELDAQYTIEALRKTIKVDGKIDDAWHQIDAAEATKMVKDLTTVDPENCPTAKIKCLWDDEHLYVLADVKDNAISTKNGNAWAQDSVELFIDEDHSKSTSYDRNDFQFRVSAIGDVSFGGNAKAKQLVAKVDSLGKCRLTPRLWWCFKKESSSKSPGSAGFCWSGRSCGAQT